MKIPFQVRVIGAVMIFTLLAFSAGAAEYFVVIGAFAKEANARKFSGYARNLYLEAYYTLSGAKNLYYVHVMKTTQKEEARNWSLYLKKETGFKDAWVFTEAMGPEKSLTEANHNGRARYSGNASFLVWDNKPTPSAHASREVYASENAAAAEADSWNAVWTNIDEVSYIPNVPGITNAKKHLDKVAGKLFTFIVETPDAKTLSTEVMLVNYEKAKKLSSFNTNEFVAIRGQKKNQTVTIVCDVFGYSQVTKTINLDKLNSARDMKQNAEGVWEVRFRLKPMEENEISVMYNTTFYEDASILQPTSQKQVDELLALMKSRPEYKILIHSHCSKAAKRAIKLPATSKGYFDIEDTYERTGSDKNLSKERAETIRAYLVDNGIHDKRIDILGWGSMEMLVSPTSADARINDRIEIELLAKW